MFVIKKNKVYKKSNLLYYETIKSSNKYRGIISKSF